jgi:ubiquinone/menaquinone biosynthesis C-methylase UbiE
MSFADGTFDLLVSNLGINNFDDPPAVLCECRRVARPGAKLALTTNLQGHMQQLYGLYAQVLAATPAISSRLSRPTSPTAPRSRRSATCSRRGASR